MVSRRRTVLAAAGLGLAVAAAGALSLPSQAAGFALLGGSLNIDSRGFRVWNNFTDVTANNNTVPHVNFPGQTGAVMAIWKGQVEWASGPYAGNGLGDGLATNVNLGDGGANFDNSFQGTATTAGGQIHSELSGNGGSVLAFTVGGGGGGWSIKYYSSWTWQDGPGSVTSGVDLQGVACHEIGHALGLGHSNFGGTTMFPSITGTGSAQRSIETDDKNGIQAIYGVKSASKPTITSLTGSKQIGQSLIVNGTNFTATGNDVWFTRSSPGDGTPIKVLNAASTNGNTKITVTVPFGIQDGEVLVKNGAGTAFSNLSNAFPIDIQSASGNPPFLQTVNPALGPAGGFQSVTLSGGGFTGTTAVIFGPSGAISFTVNNDATITAVAPPGTFFQQVDVTVIDNEGSTTLPLSYQYWLDPLPEITGVAPGSGPMTGGTEVTITGPSVVGVSDVTFDGVSGTSVEVVTANQLTVITPPGAAGLCDVTANAPLAGSSTLVNGFNYIFAAGQFVSIEPGVGGALGIPLLAGSGDLTPASGTGFTLTTSNCLGSAPAGMFFSLVQAALPFKGGTLYTFPLLLTLTLPTSPAGQILLPSTIPAGTPSGTTIFCQTWVKDASGPVGFAGSNGLKLITP